jgi:hypothetical protein
VHDDGNLDLAARRRGSFGDQLRIDSARMRQRRGEQEQQE